MPYKSPAHLPADEARARKIRSAVRAAGGTVKLARALGYQTAESIRKFYAMGVEVPAEKCRAFVAEAKGSITLYELRPDIFAGLSTQELGYKPKSERARA